MKELAKVHGGKINPNFYADGELTPRGEKAVDRLFRLSEKRKEQPIVKCKQPVYV